MILYAWLRGNNNNLTYVIFVTVVKPYSHAYVIKFASNSKNLVWGCSFYTCRYAYKDALLLSIWIKYHKMDLFQFTLSERLYKFQFNLFTRKHILSRNVLRRCCQQYFKDISNIYSQTLFILKHFKYIVSTAFGITLITNLMVWIWCQNSEKMNA